MNERIQELAYLAEEYADTTVDGGSEFHLTFVKKFAELMVRECGVALSPMLRDMVSRSQAYTLIKEHFGVEE